MKEPESGIEATVRTADCYITIKSFWLTSVNAWREIHSNDAHYCKKFLRAWWAIRILWKLRKLLQRQERWVVWLAVAWLHGISLRSLCEQAFLEGNKFFRESNLDAAKIHYSWALKVLQNRLTNVEHHKATALSNIGLIEFIEGSLCWRITVFVKKLVILLNSVFFVKEWESNSIWAHNFQHRKFCVKFCAIPS